MEPWKEVQMDWRHPKAKDALDVDALYIMQIRFISAYTKNKITKPTRDFSFRWGEHPFYPNIILDLC